MIKALIIDDEPSADKNIIPDDCALPAGNKRS